jgi:hypothetical protein
MGARGRRSAGSSAVVIPGNFGQRAEPPEDLTPEEAVIWRGTVSSEPAEFFNTAALRAMLKDYCCHRAEADRITSIVRQFKTDWLKSSEGMKRYQVLLKARDLECRGAAAMARALRLTNQSRFRSDTAGTAAKHAAKGRTMPWDFDGEEEDKQ